MEKKQVKELIAQAARAFDAELHTDAYRVTHADQIQLSRLLSYVPKGHNQVFLDIGTGAGYVAMALAKQYTSSKVIGVDVAEKAIRRDTEVASDQGLSNLQFQTFDGITLPFADGLFDGVFCRYAFHHLPLPLTTLSEIHRTLREPGKFVFSDAVRSEVDSVDFINKFQSLKNDGHVRMATTNDLLQVFEQHGFILKDSFRSSIWFDRNLNSSYGKLIEATPEQVLRAYDLSIEGNEIRLRFEILNVLLVPAS
ncbi:MAG: methyltransferase domain-containing protein [Arenicellales bacterium]|nr:methyltransferase domain-containing protein [Arenicellales bacterium]